MPDQPQYRTIRRTETPAPWDPETIIIDMEIEFVDRPGVRGNIRMHTTRVLLAQAPERVEQRLHAYAIGLIEDRARGQFRAPMVDRVQEREQLVPVGHLAAGNWGTVGDNTVPTVNRRVDWMDMGEFNWETREARVAPVNKPARIPEKVPCACGELGDPNWEHAQRECTFLDRPPEKWADDGPIVPPDDVEAF